MSKATHNAGRITAGQHKQLKLLSLRLGRPKKDLVAEAIENVLSESLLPEHIPVQASDDLTKEAGHISEELNLRLKKAAILTNRNKEDITAFAINRLLARYKDASQPKEHPDVNT